MSVYSDARTTISKYRVKGNNKAEDMQQDINSLKERISAARAAKEAAIKSSSVEEYQTQVATEEMLMKQLEKKEGEYAATVNYPSIDATTVNILRNDLKATVKNSVLSKYQSLIDLMESAASIVDEIDTEIREYNGAMEQLESLILGHETDSRGLEYKHFTVSDVVMLDGRVKDAFPHKSNGHSIQRHLKNRIDVKSI